MKKISDSELDNIAGGGTPFVGVGLVISAIIVFIAGILDGYTNPGSCECKG